MKMKRMNLVLALAGVAVALVVSTGNMAAQGRGNFDPAQFRQRQLERLKENLEVNSDAEWKVISERIEKVLDAQRETRVAGFGGFGRGGGRRGGDNGGGGGGNGGGAPGGGNRPNPFGAENPNLDALQKAV